MKNKSNKLFNTRVPYAQPFFLQFVVSQAGGTEEVKSVVVKMDFFFMVHVSNLAYFSTQKKSNVPSH